MTSKVKRILLLTLLPILIAMAIGYYFYNRGPVDISDSKGIPVDAATLYQDYLQDTASASIKYGSKVLEVTGTLQEARKTSQGEYIILLQTGTEGAFINCSLEGKAVDPALTGKITVKGICDGLLMDQDLGIPGDVILKRAVLKK